METILPCRSCKFGIETNFIEGIGTDVRCLQMKGVLFSEIAEDISFNTYGAEDQKSGLQLCKCYYHDEKAWW